MIGQEDKNGFDIKDIRIIRLSRYTYSKLENGSQPEESKDEEYDQFYLFDYYDGLTCIKDEEGSLGYEDCMGLDNPSFKDVIRPKKHNTTAVQSWSLVRLNTDDEQNTDPFKYKTEDKNYLSDRPFLAITTVTINPEHFYNYNKYYPSKLARDFIQECLDSIQSKIKDAIQKSNIKSKPLIDVFVSVNYGDFCVVVRTSDIFDAFAISIILRSANNNIGTDKKYKIRFSTFTTMGIETGMKENLPLTIKDEHARTLDKHYIVLRLSAHSDIIPELMRIAVKNEKVAINEPLGIYGRYDISIRLTIQQFSKLYPLLCHYKLNMGNLYAIPSIIEENDELVSLLDCALRDKKMHIINERPLLFLEKDGGNSYPDYSCFYKASIDKFRTRLNNLREKIDDVTGKAYMLPYRRKEFLELMRLIKELYKTYIPMWYQHDSRINIYLIYQTLYMVVWASDSYIKKIADLKYAIEENTKLIENDLFAVSTLCKSLIESLNKAVYQINSLAKVLQSINLQTIQMPNYEIQTQVDLEKYVVSFTEFLREFSASFYQNYKHDQHYRVMPFITLDLTAEKVSAEHLFHPVIPPELNGVTPSTAELNNIIIPSFECLARAYDLLLLLCHEMTHSFRFISRTDRNKFVIESILGRMSEYIANQWISLSSPNLNYLNVDSLVKFTSDAINEALMENCSIEGWLAYPFRSLEASMEEFFLKKVFTERNRHTTSNPTKSSLDTVIDALKYIYTKALGVDDDDMTRLESVKKEYKSFIKHINAKVRLNELIVKRVQKCIQEYAKISTWNGTKLEEFYKKTDFSNAVDIELDEIETILPCIENSNERDLIGFLKKELQKRKLFITDGIVCMESKFVIDVCTDLKYYASKNIFFELEEYFKTNNPLSPCNLIKHAFDIAILDEKGRVELERKTIALEKTIKELYKKSRDLENAFSSKNEKGFIKAGKGVTKALTSLSKSTKIIPLSAEEIKKLKTLVKIANEKVYAYIQDECDINYQYTCATKAIRDNPDGIPVCSNVIRERIIKSIHSKLNFSYLNDEMDDKVNKTVLESSQIYSLLSALCIHSNEQENFSENLRKCFYSFSDEQISGMVKSFGETYREVVADLGMCAAMSLTSFGYLKFYMRYYHRGRSLNSDLSLDMTSERAAAVVNTLLGTGKDNTRKREELKNNVRTYIEHVFQSTCATLKNDIMQEIEKKKDLQNNLSVFFEKWNKFEKDLTQISDNYIKAMDSIGSSDFFINPCYEMLVQGFRSSMQLDENSEELSIYREVFDDRCTSLLINKYFERFDRLYYLLSLLHRVFQTDISERESDHYKHLYYECIKSEGKPYCIWEKPNSGIDVRKSVSEYFNSTEPYEEEITSKILRNTFAFILEYYYRNRLAYSNDPSFDDDWIIELTGGK